MEILSYLVLFAVAVLMVAVLTLAWILPGYWLCEHLLLILARIDFMVLAGVYLVVLAWVDLVVLPTVQQVNVHSAGFCLPLLILLLKVQLERSGGGLEEEYSCTCACTSRSR